VALGLPVAVEFRPVLVSRVISGKNRLTPLSGTMTLRGSVMPDVAGDEELSHVSARAPTAAIDNAVSRPGRDPAPMSPGSSRFISSRVGTRCLGDGSGTLRDNDRLIEPGIAGLQNANVLEARLIG